MNYLSVENLSKSFGINSLFDGISFGIDYGQKVAFVANNGTGKTTLLNILSERDTPDSGTVTWRKGIKIGFLHQDPKLPEDCTVIEAVFVSENTTLSAIRQYEEAIQNPEDSEAYQAAFEQMDRLNAWDYETRIRQILSKLKIDRLDQQVSTLSGGQKKRVALAKILIDEPDFIILDEPTNHLDLEMIEWLERFLAKEETTIFMVTHDRYFLERVCDIILELDNKQLFRYKGNFSYYLQKRDERYANAAVELDKAKSLMKTELEWIRRQPKARGTKSKSRVDAFAELKKKASQRIEERDVQLEVNMSRLGSKIIELHKVKKSYGKLQILDSFDYVFQRNERVGIIGKNGVGKSSFLHLLTGNEEPDGGKIVVGETIVFGYYTQAGIKLNGSKRVIEVIKDIAEYIPLSKGRKMSAAQLLERFLFSRDDQYKFVEKLSGGERKRLYLCTILMQNPNFLILDEPTNDLDIGTLSVLEDFLGEFAGCLVIVSHDRYFMDKLVDHLFVFEGAGKISDFPGNYGQYREYQKLKEAPKAQPAKAAPKPSTPKPPSEKKKLTYKEKLEFEQLEKDIERLEARKIELTEILNSGITDHAKLMETGDELGVIVPETRRKRNALAWTFRVCLVFWIGKLSYVYSSRTFTSGLNVKLHPIVGINLINELRLFGVHLFSSLIYSNKAKTAFVVVKLNYSCCHKSVCRASKLQKSSRI